MSHDNNITGVFDRSLFKTPSEPLPAGKRIRNVIRGEDCAWYARVVLIPGVALVALCPDEFYAARVADLFNFLIWERDGRAYNWSLNHAQKDFDENPEAAEAANRLVGELSVRNSNP